MCLVLETQRWFWHRLCLQRVNSPEGLPWVLLQLLATSESNSQAAWRLLWSGQGIPRVPLKHLSSELREDNSRLLSGSLAPADSTGLHVCFIHTISDSTQTPTSPLFSKPQQLTPWTFLNGNGTVRGQVWVSAVPRQAPQIPHHLGIIVDPVLQSGLWADPTCLLEENHKPNWRNGWFTNSYWDR